MSLRGQSPDPDTFCMPTVKLRCRSGQGAQCPPWCTILAELSAWLEERHADLHDALTKGENAPILELTAKVSEGAERMMGITGGMCP